MRVPATPSRSAPAAPNTRLRPLALALAGAWLLAGAPALQAQQAVLPSGLQVVHGQAQVATQGGAMTVRNSAGAILNWQSFSIGAGNSVYFDQASAASKVLNRVTGQDPSQIMGRLGSNGQVWLLNPHGVLFGRDARVDVAALVAGTLRLGDSDFLAGRQRLQALPQDQAGVRNLGALHTSFGGQVVLLGSQVDNRGDIQTPGGQTTLAAARSVELVDTGLPHLAVRVEVPAGEVLNLGRLAAAGGAVDLYGGIVNQQGLVQVDALTADAQGRIRLQASDTLLLGAASRTSAQGVAGSGGDIALLGRQVGLLAGAEVDASGASGGGRIRVGGGLQGRDASLPNAQRVGIAAGARLRADAQGSGDGGEVIVWADGGTRFQGHISARGGAAGGDGGFAEVSGRQALDYAGTADLAAPAGRAGSLLLDPAFIVIQQANPDISGNTPGVDLGTPALLFADFPTSTSVITSGAVSAQLALGNVVLQASQDIDFVSATTPISGAGRLTLQAGRNINLQSAISAAGGITLSANDPGGAATGSGSVFVGAPLDAGAGALLITSNGSSVAHLLQADLSAGTLTLDGDVQLGIGSTWTLAGGTSVASGILFGTAPLTKAGAGTLRLTGANTHAGTTIAGGTLSVSGVGASAGVGTIAVGANTLEIDNGAVVGNSISIAGGTIGNGAGLGTLSGSTALAGNATLRSSGAGLRVNGPISGSAGITAGGGNVTLAGPGLYSGGTTVAAGSLSASGVNTQVGTGPITVLAGAQFNLDNGIGLSNPVVLDGGTLGNNLGSGLLIGDLTLASASSVASSGTGGLSLAGVISGPGGLSKLGPSTVTLNAANVYAGGTAVLAGTLATNGAERLPDGGALSVAPGAVVSLGGAETVASLALAGTLNGGTLTAASYALNGATVNAALGAGTLASDGDSLLNGSAAAGTLVVGSGALTLGTGGRLLAAPDVQVAAGAALVLTGDETLGSLAGGGTVNLGTATLATGLSGASTSFAGSILGSGSLVKAGAGTFTVTGALAHAGPTTVDAGTLALDSATTLSTLVLNGGQLAGSGAVTVTGPFVASGGAAGLAGSGSFTTLGSSSVAMVNAGAAVLAVDKPWLNSGTLSIGDDDRLVLGATTLTNAAGATLVLASSDAVPLGSSAPASRLVNAGTLIQGVAGSHGVTVGSFDNSGAVLVLAGTLGLNAVITQGGLIDVAAGSTLDVAGNLDNAGTLGGAGSIVLAGGSGTLGNLGVISPGPVGGVGTLSVSGNVSLLSGTLQVDLGGPGASDRLAVSGDVALAGTLSAALFGSYAPINGDFMPIVTATGAAVGSFGTLALPAGFNPGYNLAAGEAARLIFALGGATRVFSNAAGNLDWGTPANWGGTLPTAADSALISAGFAVQHNRGDDTVAELTLSGGNALSVTGGTLTVLGNTALDGLLTLAGGSATLAGVVTGAGALDLQSGSLTLNGPATFASANLDGGTLGGSGNFSVTSSFTRNPLAQLGTRFASISLNQVSGNLQPGGLAAGNVLLRTQDPASTLLIDSDVASSGGLGIAAAGALRLVSGGALTVAGDAQLSAATVDLGGPVDASRLRVGASAGVLLAPGALLQARGTGDALVLSAGSGPFVNNAGAGALATAAGARWLLWSADPLADTVGGLAAAFRQYDANLGVTTPAAPGNGLLYSLAPTLTASLQGTVSKVYDNTVAATLVPANYTQSGALAIDSVALSTPAAGSYTSAGSGNAPKDVGSGKTVTASGVVATATDAGTGIPVFGYRFSGSASGAVGSITPLALSLSGTAVADKNYDGGTAASFSSLGSVTPLGADVVAVGGAATASFSDKNVGTAKPVTVAGLALTGPDAANYTLLGPGPLTASIIAAPLPVTGLSVLSKPYDGSTAAPLAGVATIAPVAGDAVALVGTASASFGDANVGIGKLVGLSGLALSGADAANYALEFPVGVNASITPATLTYVAAPLTAPAGQPLPALGGSVTGFVAGETLAGATSGSLAWTTPASSASPAGSYAILGSGLAATNYVFVQAASNATALTLDAPPLPPPPPAALLPETPTAATVVGFGSALLSVQIPLAMSSPVAGRVLDATPAFVPMAADPGGGGAPVFGAINLSQLPRTEVQSLLAARDGYKKKVLAGGLYKLEQDPALADVRPCRSEAELAGGNCIITQQLKQEIELIAARAAAARAGAAAKPQARARKPGQRPVKQAVLPRIERKLALLIGVNRYADKAVPQLEGAVPDVRAVRTLLETRLGYETQVLEDAGREAIVRAFNKLALEADADDSVIIYYAGHGVVVPIDGVDTGFWLPSDVDAGDPRSWLANADIARMVAAIGSRQLMLVSDSCYSGTLAGSERVQLAPVSDPSALLDRRAAVVMSSGGNEPVADEGREGHSVFAWHLMRALEGLDQWQPGSNLFERVRAGVVKDFPQTPQYGASRAAGHQGGTDYVFERRELGAVSP